MDAIEEFARRMKQQETAEKLEQMKLAAAVYRRMIPPDDQKKFDMAVEGLRKMCEMDPINFSMAMMLVTSESMAAQMSLLDMLKGKTT